MVGTWWQSGGNKYILSIQSADANLQAAGGMGMNLAILARAGFPAPSGFILSSVAYRALVAENLRADDTLHLAHEISPEDLQAIEAASRQMQGRINQASLAA